MNQHGPFARAFLLSLAIHIALALLVAFAPTPGPAVRHEDSLQVVLVNARGQSPLSSTRLVAQAPLDGGGEASEPIVPTATTPPTPAPLETVPTEAVSPPAPVQSAAAPQTHAPLSSPRNRPESSTTVPTLAAAKGGKRPPPPAEAKTPDPPSSSSSDGVRGVDLLDAAAAIAQLQAQVAAQTRAIAERPRTRYVGVTVTEHPYALYLEAWREKVERVGTLNYPPAARGKLYGSLILQVAINRDGKLIDAKVIQSSGHSILDQAAVKTVHLAAPYARFPPEIAQETDILVITRRWTFTRNHRLTTQ